jgi:hypothetical protein
MAVASRHPPKSYIRITSVANHRFEENRCEARGAALEYRAFRTGS